MEVQQNDSHIELYARQDRIVIDAAGDIVEPNRFHAGERLCLIG
jgi:hypothetical protein